MARCHHGNIYPAHQTSSPSPTHVWAGIRGPRERGWRMEGVWGSAVRAGTRSVFAPPSDWMCSWGRPYCRVRERGCDVP